MRNIICTWLVCLGLCACGDETTDGLRPTIFIGDSITHMWPLPPDIDNEGINGQTSLQMLARFEDDVMSKRPRIVAILAGTNDIRLLRSTDTQSIEKMANRAAASGACVILGTVPPVADWAYGVSPAIDAQAGNADIARINVALSVIATSHGYKLADYHTALSGSKSTHNPALFADPVHPGPEGYKAMWAVVQPLLDQCG